MDEFNLTSICWPTSHIIFYHNAINTILYHTTTNTILYHTATYIILYHTATNTILCACVWGGGWG